MVHFPFYRKSRIIKPIKVPELSEVDCLKLDIGYYNGPTHSFHIRCQSILLNIVRTGSWRLWVRTYSWIIHICKINFKQLLTI